MPSEATKKADELEFQLSGYKFSAASEVTRAPRIVRIGLVQNKIVIPTTAPVNEQVRTAACTVCNVNLCMC